MLASWVICQCQYLALFRRANDDDSEAHGQHSGHPNASLNRCPFSRRQNVDCDVDALISAGRLFQTVGDAVRKARAAIFVLALPNGGIDISTAVSERRLRLGLYSLMSSYKYAGCLCNRNLNVVVAILY